MCGGIGNDVLYGDGGSDTLTKRQATIDLSLRTLLLSPTSSCR